MHPLFEFLQHVQPVFEYFSLLGRYLLFSTFQLCAVLCLVEQYNSQVFLLKWKIILPLCSKSPVAPHLLRINREVLRHLTYKVCVMWQLVTSLTSSPTVLLLALPYWSPCCTLYVPCILLLLGLCPHFSICVECSSQITAMARFLSVTGRPMLLICLKLHPVFCKPLPHPCALSLFFFPLLLSFNIYYLHITCIIMCFPYWSISYTREEFWSFTYWCIPDIRSSAWHTVGP